MGISQSGESTDTNAYLEEAARRGATTIGITNEAQSTLARIGQYTLLVHAGKEESVAATKTYTGQMMALYLLAFALGGSIDWPSLEQIAESTTGVDRVVDELQVVPEPITSMSE